MKKKIIKLSITLLVILGLILFLIIRISGLKTKYEPRASYDKTGFVQAENLAATPTILENQRFKMVFDNATTQFTLLDKITNQTWNSVGTHQDEDLLIPADARELFVLYFEQVIESPKAMRINDESIKYKNYQVRQTTNSIEVLYGIGGKKLISMSDLPIIMSVDKYNEKIINVLQVKAETNSALRRNLNFLKSMFSEQDGKVFLKTLATQDSIDIMYNLIFELSDYTMEDLEEDSKKYGFQSSVEIPYFEFSVKYEITNKGFDVTLINDSIYESENFPIAYIDILPYFGTNNVNDEGFTIIPDGSGLFINHNNNKYASTEYEKRIYGADLSVGTGAQIDPNTGEKISLPMYGYNKNGLSFINIVEQGEAMSSIRSGFLTESSAGTLVHKIPYVSYRYYLRERDAFIFNSAASMQRVSTWTLDYNTEDFKSSYQFISTDDSTYYEMALQYQTYLVNKYELNEKVNATPLHINLLGGYRTTKYFLGFPYEKIESLTKANDLVKVANELKNKGINDFDLTYQGFLNKGVKSTTMTKTDFNRSIASKNQLKNATNNLSDLNVDLYLEYYLQTAHSDENLNVKKQVVKNIFNDDVYRYPYNPATNVADNSKTITYLLNLNAQNKVAKNILSTMSKVNNNNVSINDLNKVASNLIKGDVSFRNETIHAQEEILKNFNEQNIQLRNPSLYALVYADQILDLPVEATLHKSVDYAIPFMQLVLNGYFNYSGPSVNTYNSKTTNWHLLKALETGSELQFTFTYENTLELLKTEYSYLYSTYYVNWLEDLVSMTNLLNDLDTVNQRITSHKVLNAQGSLVEVKYENGLTLHINYETESYQVL